MSQMTNGLPTAIVRKRPFEVDLTAATRWLKKLAVVAMIASALCVGGYGFYRLILATRDGIRQARHVEYEQFRGECFRQGGDATSGRRYAPLEDPVMLCWYRGRILYETPMRPIL